MAFTINSVGNGLSPFDSFLLLRGVKTLAIRMDRQQSTALLVAQMLSKLGFVTHYPGLPGHPGKEIHERIADGMFVIRVTLLMHLTYSLLHQDMVLSCHSRLAMSNSVSASLRLHVSGESVSALAVSTV